MSTLTEMVEQLATLVPPMNGVPSDDQYERAIVEAIADFGRRVPRLLWATLDIVAGTATYTLPAGFQRLIGMDPPATGPFYNNDGFLVAGITAPNERYTITGNEIKFIPAPTYTAVRLIRYAAGMPYDAEDDVFVGLDAAHESIILLRARATAQRTQTLSGDGGGLTYRIGDVSVDKSAATQSALAQADEWDAAYNDAVRSLTGFVGRRGTPPEVDY